MKPLTALVIGLVLVSAFAAIGSLLLPRRAKSTVEPEQVLVTDVRIGGKPHVLVTWSALDPKVDSYTFNSIDFWHEKRVVHIERYVIVGVPGISGFGRASQSALIDRAQLYNGEYKILLRDGNGALVQVGRSGGLPDKVSP